MFPVMYMPGLRWQLLDRELLEKSTAQASTWHKSRHLEDIQNVGWMSPESVTHAGDPNVTEYAINSGLHVLSVADRNEGNEGRKDSESFTSPPPRDFLLDIAKQRNQTPLPLIKPCLGSRLPTGRYSLTAPNYRFKP
eukprot:bmy_16842T0